jgi:hypothetical protein
VCDCLKVIQTLTFWQRESRILYALFDGEMIPFEW